MEVPINGMVCAPQPEPGTHFGLLQRAAPGEAILPASVTRCSLQGSVNKGSHLSGSLVPATRARARASRALWSCLAWLIGTALSVPQAHAAIAYVQKNYAVPQSPHAQVTVPVTGA